MLSAIIKQIHASGGHCFYVGGYVRDALLGLPWAAHDKDIEIFGLSREQVFSILSTYGKVHEVGKAYSIFKLRGHPEWDFSVAQSPELTYREACLRRDFTINAVMQDVASGRIVDPLHGREDIKQGIIRHTNPEVFKADPLRAYRAVQLAARFNFTIDPAAMDLIKSTDLSKLDQERIFFELRKLLLSAHPSLGLRYMLQCGILEQMHPMLYALAGCKQEESHHPEGDTFNHTLLVVDRCTQFLQHSRNPQALMMAALLHDIGKPVTSGFHKGKITTYGHDVKGSQMAASFLQELRAPQRLIAEVRLLIKEHMQPVLLYKQRERVSDKAIRRLLSRVNVGELLLLSEADYLGRGIERDYEPIKTWLIGRIEQLGLNLEGGITPLVRGRDLIEMGLEPGRDFALLLQEAFELQMEGMNKNEIIEALRLRTAAPGQQMFTGDNPSKHSEPDKWSRDQGV